MRITQTPEASEPPPPPYTPSTSDAQSEAPPNIDDVEELPGRTQQLNLEASQNDQSPSHDVHTPASIADYIASRPFERGEVLQNEGVLLSYLTHIIVLLPSSRTNDIPFPEPTETYFNRDVKFQDWNTLKSHLLPPHNQALGCEKPTGTLSSDQRQRIAGVLAEWNKSFFSPRRICIEARYELPTPPALAPDDQSRSMPHTNSMPSNRLNRSYSTSSSSSSHSESSISSISSEDIENVPPTTIRNLLLAFREDPSKKAHLRSAVEELRSQFHAEAKNTPPEERKELRRNYRKEQRELKKEIRRILRDARNERRNERKARHKADRYQRKVERKARKHGGGGGGSMSNSRQGSYHHHPHHPHNQSLSPSYTTLPRQQESGVVEAGVPLSGAPTTPPVYAPHDAPLPSPQHSRQQQQQAPPQQGCRRGTGFSSGRRAPSWGQQSTTSGGSAARGLGQWVRAAEDACRVAGQTANDAARQLDNVFREGERQLHRGMK